MKERNVLFVCTGNYYRSRFAEIYFNYLMLGTQWLASSKGFVADNPNNIGHLSPHAIKKLDEYHIPYQEDAKYPEKITEDHIMMAEIVIALKESEHRPFVEKNFPDLLEKFVFWKIDDVQDNPPETAIPLLKREVEELTKVLQSV